MVHGLILAEVRSLVTGIMMINLAFIQGQWDKFLAILLVTDKALGGMRAY
ncbi:MAG: hypothetical protein ABIB41_08780 [Nitrospirota bacterium]